MINNPFYSWNISLLNGIWEPIEFNCGQFEPIIEKSKLDEYLNEYLNRDNFFYPRPHRSYSETRTASEYVYNEIPNSYKIPLIWKHIKDDKVFCSHKFSYKNETDQNRRIPFIIINYLAMIHETRLVFEDWWHESRVKIPFFKSPNAPFSWSIQQLPKMINEMEQKILSIPEEKIKKLFNIMYLRNKTASYEFTWERFAWRYTVLDDCWAFLKEEIQTKKTIRHGERIAAMCEHFNIGYQLDLAEEIVSMRNDIVHEINSKEEGITHSGGQNSYILTEALLGLIDRIIINILGIECTYKSNRWHKGLSGKIRFNESLREVQTPAQLLQNKDKT